MENNLQTNRLFEILKIKPKNRDLYIEALTHASYANENNKNYNYQRLEFLGDAILQTYVSLWLYKKYPKCDEGFLTIERSKIVREEAIEQLVNKQLSISHFILLGKGEQQSNGNNNPRILADIYESLIGAIYLDLGSNVAQEFIERTLIAKVLDSTITLVEDYKTLMQEYLQGEKIPTLKYEILKEENNNFFIIAKLGDLILSEGKGTSRLKAEQDAARNAYKKLVKK